MRMRGRRTRPGAYLEGLGGWERRGALLGMYTEEGNGIYPLVLHDICVSGFTRHQVHWAGTARNKDCESTGMYSLNPPRLNDNTPSAPYLLFLGTPRLDIDI